MALSTVVLPVADGVTETAPLELIVGATEPTDTLVVVVGDDVIVVVVGVTVATGAVDATTPAVATVEAIFCCSSNILVAYAVE